MRHLRLFHPLLYRVFARFFALLLAFSLGQPAAALAQAKPEARADLRPVRVGYVVDRAGPWVNDSRDFFAGSKVLLDDINAKSSNRPFRISLRDGDGTPERARQAVLELVRDDKVDVILGLAGDATLAAVAEDDSFRREGVPLIAPMSGLAVANPAAGKQVFFARADYGQEVQHVLRYLRGLGVSRLALLRQAATPVAVQAAVRAALANTADAQGFVLEDLALPAAGPARTSALQRLAQKAPQALLVLGDSLEYAAVFQAYQSLSPGAYIIGLSTVNPRTLLELVPAAKVGGAMISQVMSNPARTAIPLSREFERLFKKYFDEPPSHQSLSGFVAAQQLVNALGRVNGPVTRAGLQAALQAGTRVDVYGFDINYQTAPQRGSQFVDVLMIRSDGRLVQ